MNKDHHIMLESKKAYKDIIVRMYQLRKDIQKHGKILDEYPYRLIHCFEKDQLVSLPGSIQFSQNLK
jgi:hypothetical protein